MIPRRAVERFFRWVLVAAAAAAMLCHLEVGAAQVGEPAVARVFGEEIRCGDLRAADPQQCANALLRHARRLAARRYVERHGLSATDEELQRLTKYNENFARQDQAQRARKRAELDQRLADAGLPSSERSRMESFRAALVRLEGYERDVIAGREPPDRISRETLLGWIEQAKLNAALYARYGGIVGIAAFGPYPHGALVALLDGHMARGEIQVLDPTVAHDFDSALHQPPTMILKDAVPDFTPYWERPIPPSYFAQ
jgi:hypothetical protein